MYVLPYEEAERVLQSARCAFPCEACGVMLKRRYGRHERLFLVPTKTDENSPISFVIRTEAYRRIEAALSESGLSVCGCFHSHVFGSCRPSRKDAEGKKRPGDLWMIYSMSTRELGLFQWTGARFERQRYRIAA